MNYFEILFYSFASLMVLSAIMVISSRNPVHSVFFLILVFCLAAGLLLLLNVEFLSIIFIIVYVGAIAVLFLFVVMMLNIRLVEINESLVRYMPLGGVVGLVFLLELFYLLKESYLVREKDVVVNRYDVWVEKIDSVPNIEMLGQVLYTYYVYYFILAGVILLVSMIGTIVLTLHHKINVKRQEVYKQVGRDFMSTVVKKDLV